MHRTIDRGQTWTYLGEHGWPVLDPRRPALVRAVGEVALAPTSTDLHEVNMCLLEPQEGHLSRDGGETWEDYAVFDVFEPGNSRVLYRRAGPTVELSRDDGMSWIDLQPPFANIATGEGVIALFGLAPQQASDLRTLIAVTIVRDQAGGARPSTWLGLNGGATWTEIDFGQIGALPNYPRAISSSAVSPRHLAAITHDPDAPIKLSNDGGLTWRDAGRLAIGRIVPEAIAVHPTDSHHIFVAGNFLGPVVIRSRDGGVTWQHLDEDFHRDLGPIVVRHLALSRSQDFTVYLGTSNGVFRKYLGR